MKTAIWLGLKPKWWQVIRVNVSPPGPAFIVCEHRTRMAAWFCMFLRIDRKAYYHDYQCRAGCGDCLE
jgi:hypothetical protein